MSTTKRSAATEIESNGKHAKVAVANTNGDADADDNALEAPELPSEWHSWATSSMRVRLVDSAVHLDSTLSNVSCREMTPIYTHQLVDDELLVGYKRPRVVLSLVRDSLLVYAHMSYADKCATPPHTNVARLLRNAMPPGVELHFDRAAFAKLAALGARDAAAAAAWTPPGTLRRSFASRAGRRFEIYAGRTGSDAALREYVARASIFVPFFIETGNYIALAENDAWLVYLLFERDDDGERRTFAGFVTIYRWASLAPDRERWRISQMLVLPPFQRQGHGQTLLRTIYADAVSPPNNVVDITIEEPSDAFARMRDAVDLELLLQAKILPLDESTTSSTSTTTTTTTTRRSVAGEPRSLVDASAVKRACQEAQSRFRLCELQTRRLIRAARYLASADANKASDADATADVANPLSLSLRERWCAARHWRLFGAQLARLRTLHVPTPMLAAAENDAANGLAGVIDSWNAEVVQFERLRPIFKKYTANHGS